MAAPKIQLRIGWILLAYLLCFVQDLTAQSSRKTPPPPPDTTVKLDSASLSRDLKKLAKDSVNKIKQSDTAVALLINRIESYTFMLNQNMSILRRGFDTSSITDNLPIMDASLALIKKNIATLGRTPNIHDVYTNKVMLQQLERNLKNWQDALMRYYGRLVNISDTMSTIRRDTAMRNIPAEDELYGFYIGQMANLIQKYRQVDSANRKNLLQLGLLQNKVANRYIEVTNLLEDMDFQLSSFTQRMFNRDYSYLWRDRQKEDGKKLQDFISVLHSSVNKSVKVLALFFAVQWPVFIIWIFIAVIFSLWVYNNIRRIRKHHDPSDAEAILKHSRYLYQFPIACTLVFVATLASFLSVKYPILFTEFTWGIIVIALSVVLRQYLPKIIFRYWLLLLGLLFLYSLNNLLIEATFVEEWGLFAGALCATILGIYLLKHTANPTFKQPRYTRFILWMMVILSSFSLLLVLFARITAAKIIGASSIINTAMAMVLYVFVEIVMEAVYLQVEANKDSSTFISFVDYQQIKSKLQTFLYAVAGIGWLMLFARNLYIYDNIYDSVGDFLGKTRQIGTTDFTFGSIIIFMVVIWVASIVTQLIAYLFGNSGQNKAPSQKVKLGSAMLLIRLAILTIGILIAFAASGIPMDKLAIVIGALGVGIGFGLQNIVNNLVSGIILAFEKPIEIGDVIELGTRSGVVKEIGIRSSKISAYDGSEVIVPNGELISQQLINWTLSSRTRRVELIIGVGYGSNVAQVMDILKKSMENREGILTTPAPLVFLYQFGDNSVNYRMFFWIGDLGNAGQLQSDVMTTIYEDLQKAGIEIPFPQRDLHIRSVDPEVLKQWGETGPEKQDNP
jgi:potassium efflux system protein